MDFYDFEVQQIDGGSFPLRSLQGRVALLVNTASKCGFTPQFEELEALYQQYRDKGLEILAFPCNQFAGQDPEPNDKILAFCRMQYGVTFPIFAKIEVNGEQAHPLYKWLTAQKGFAGFDMAHPIAPKLVEILSEQDPAFEKSPAIKWNFTKFLIDRAGKVVRRFEPTAPMQEIRVEIEKLL
ncbi:MAG: glutathione peroxidase [Oscillospiraceae bacterium]